MVVKDREAPHLAKNFKELNATQLARLQTLEKKTGCCIVAMELRPRIAQLTQAQLNELQSLEKEMNTVLIAYACQP